MSEIFHPAYDWQLKADGFAILRKFLSMLKNRMQHQTTTTFRQPMTGGS